MSIYQAVTRHSHSTGRIKDILNYNCEYKKSFTFIIERVKIIVLWYPFSMNLTDQENIHEKMDPVQY